MYNFHDEDSPGRSSWPSLLLVLVFAFLSLLGSFVKTSPEPLGRFTPALGAKMSDSPPVSRPQCARGLGLLRLPRLPRLPGMPLVRLMPRPNPNPPTVMVDGVGREAPRLSVDLARTSPLLGPDPPESVEPNEVTDCLLWLLANTRPCPLPRLWLCPPELPPRFIPEDGRRARTRPALRRPPAEASDSLPSEAESPMDPAEQLPPSELSRPR